MSIRGALRGTGNQVYQGGQVVTTGQTFYSVPGTYNDDLNILQQVITADGYGAGLTPQQVISTGAVDGYAVGSLNINVATSAVPYAANILHSPQGSGPAAPPPGSSGTGNRTNTMYVGGQVRTTATYYTVPGTYADDLNVIQQVITNGRYNLTPQDVIAAGGLDGMPVGSVNINLASQAVTQALNAQQTASGSTGGTSAGPAPIGQPTGPYAPYTPPSSSPPASSTPASSTPPAQTPAGGYNFIAASSQPASGGAYYPDLQAINAAFGGDSQPVTAPAAPAGLMSTLSALPWYYYAGGAAAALFLFSGSKQR